MTEQEQAQLEQLLDAMRNDVLWANTHYAAFVKTYNPIAQRMGKEEMPSLIGGFTFDEREKYVHSAENRFLLVKLDNKLSPKNFTGKRCPEHGILLNQDGNCRKCGKI